MWVGVCVWGLLFELEEIAYGQALEYQCLQNRKIAVWLDFSKGETEWQQRN